MKKTNKYDYETTFAIIFTVVIALLLVAIIIYNIAIGDGGRLLADFIYAVIFIGSPLICLFIAQKVDDRRNKRR